MAKFILGNAFQTKLVEKPAVRHVLWGLDVLFVGFLLGIFRILPVTWASALGARLGRMAGRILKERTQRVRGNLAVALPDRSPAEIDRLAGDVWANAGAVMAEFPNLRRMVDPRRDFLQIEILEDIPTYSAPHPPAVFVGAHLANWEMAAAGITRLGIDPRIMYAPLSNPWLDRGMRHFRAALGGHLVSRSEGLREFMAALKARQSVAIVTDRRVEGGRMLPFFGEQMSASVFPARMALRFGVPLVPVQVERLPGTRFRVTFHPPLSPANPEAGPDDQAADLTRQINATFEQWITARPGDWLCTSKIWPRAVLLARTDIYAE